MLLPIHISCNFVHEPQVEAEVKSSQSNVRTRKRTKSQVKLILFCSKLELCFQFDTLITLHVIPT